MKDCQTDFDYRVVAGEVESPIYHVRVLHPLVLKTSRRPSRPRHTPGDRRKSSSRETSGPLKARESRSRSCSTRPHGCRGFSGIAGRFHAKDDPVQVGGSRLTGELPPITREIQYEIAAADGEGMKLEKERTYRVKVQPTRSQRFASFSPEESLAVTPTTEVPIQVEAGDDFGVTRLGIHYKVGDGPEETLHLAGFENQPVTAGGLATLYLEKHKLSFTDAITYYRICRGQLSGKTTPGGHRASLHRHLALQTRLRAHRGRRYLQLFIGKPGGVDRTPARESEPHLCF